MNYVVVSIYDGGYCWAVESVYDNRFFKCDNVMWEDGEADLPEDELTRKVCETLAKDHARKVRDLLYEYAGMDYHMLLICDNSSIEFYRRPV